MYFSINYVLGTGSFYAAKNERINISTHSAEINI